MEQEHFIQYLRDFLLDTDGDTSELALLNGGIFKQASDMGVDKAMLMKYFNLIDRDIRWPRVEEIKNEIKDLAIRRRKLLTEADKEEFIMKADQIGIRRAYVLEKLIPNVLSTVPIIDILTHPDAEKAYAFLQKKFNDIKYIKKEDIIALFELLANEQNESHVVGAVETFLSDNKLKNETPLTGTTAKDILTSTDWKVRETSIEEPVNDTQTEGSEPTPDDESLPDDIFEEITTIKKPIVNYFRSTDTEIMQNERITISWDVSNLETVNIVGVGKGLPALGQRDITPPSSSVYVLKTPNGDTLKQISIIVNEPKKGVSFEKIILFIVIIAILGSGYVIYDDYQRKNQTKLPAYLKSKNGILDITCNEYAELDKKSQQWGEWKPFKGGIRFFINARSVRVVTPKETDVLTITAIAKEDDIKAVIDSKNRKGIQFTVEHYFEDNEFLVKYENETVKFRPKPY